MMSSARHRQKRCNTTEIETTIRALPKVEQHVHIIGSTKPGTLLWLAEKKGLAKPTETLDTARTFYQYRDFSHFIKTYCTVVDLVTEEDQLERITYEMLEADAKCNVHHVEASFSVLDHVRRGLDYGRMIDAINRAMSRGRMDYGIECGIRIDLVRDYGPEAGMEVLDMIESKNDNVVSIDIGGRENMYPAKAYAPVYRRAKKMGLHLVAHAGEAAGVRSIWEAVRYLGVERIGHGVSAIHSPKLMSYLLEKNIVVETCPISNLRTKAVSCLEKHPIKVFIEKGLRTTVNTDDPSMFNTDMNYEFLQLHRHLGFTVTDLFQLTLNAVDSAFLPEKKKSKIRGSIIQEYQRLVNSDQRALP